MTEQEVPATFEDDEPDPPYVDNTPPAEPGEADEEPEFQPKTDVVVEEGDPR